MGSRLLLIAALAAAVCTVSAQPYSPVSLGIAPDEYFGTVYAERPIEEVPYMFYIGERILFRVDFVNRGDTVQTIPLGRRGAPRLFDAAVTKAGTAVPLRLRMDPTIVREDASGKSPISLSESQSLPPWGKLSIRGHLESIPPDPGVYVIDVSTDLADASGRPIAPQSTRFDFELRQVGRDDDAEVARRSALRALVDGDFAQAEGFVSRLLTLNPTSLAAFTARAQIAEAQGRTKEALALYRRALAILEGNQDRQYLPRTGSLQREDEIEGLRLVIRGLGGQ